MPRHVSTSLRWNIATATVLAAVTVATVWWSINRIDEYDSALARATVPIAATVVRSESYSRAEDLVVVTWRDQHGVHHEVEYSVLTPRCSLSDPPSGSGPHQDRSMSTPPATTSTRPRSTARCRWSRCWCWPSCPSDGWSDYSSGGGPRGRRRRQCRSGSGTAHPAPYPGATFGPGRCGSRSPIPTARVGFNASCGSRGLASSNRRGTRSSGNAPGDVAPC